MPEITFKSEPVQGVIAENPVPDQGLVTYFGLNPNDVNSRETYKLNEIKEFLSEIGEDEFKQFEELRNIRHRLGTPSYGTSEIDHIHKYIKLHKAMREAESRVQEMER